MTINKNQGLAKSSVQPWPIAWTKDFNKEQ